MGYSVNGRSAASTDRVFRSMVEMAVKGSEGTINLSNLFVTTILTISGMAKICDFHYVACADEF